MYYRRHTKQPKGYRTDKLVARPNAGQASEKTTIGISDCSRLSCSRAELRAEQANRVPEEPDEEHAYGTTSHAEQVPILSNPTKLASIDTQIELQD